MLWEQCIWVMIYRRVALGGPIVVGYAIGNGRRGSSANGRLRIVIAESRLQAMGPVGPRPRRGVVWPVRSGAVPPLADGFSARPETAPGLAGALVPGATVVLVPRREAIPAGRGGQDWLGACGKTQLAVYAAESLWRSDELDLLVWTAASSREAVLSSFVAAAAATGSDHVGDAESVAASFVSWLRENGRPWLVVLDDLRSAGDLDELWPAGPTGRVLITAADSGIVPGGRLVRSLPVGQFSTREALSYLMGRLTADPDQRLGAIDLVSDLGCEPPALAQASAMVASSRLTCRDYRDHFAQRRAQLAEVIRDLRSAAAVTWTLSVEHAERLSPGGGAQYLLALAAILDGHGIPGAVFTSSAACEYLGAGGPGRTVDPNVAWGALLGLERAGLLTIDSAVTPPTVRMSPTVQAAIREATTQGVFDHAARAAADALLEVWPADEPEPWLAADLRSCALTLRQVAGDVLWEGGCHPVLVRAGRSMDSARLTGPAVAYWRELAAVSDRILGPGSPDTLMAGSYLANALLAAGLPAEAVAWAQWVLAGRTRVLGPDEASTIAAAIALGRAFVAADQPDSALPVLEGAVADSERVHGADHLDTLGGRDELAAACRAAGKPGEAIALYRHALADHERLQGARHPDTMTTRQLLADTYLADGRVKEAVSQLKRVLADRERVFGPDHLDTIVARGSLAAAYHSAGKMASALQLYEQACEGYARVLGADDPETLQRRANLADAYYKAGRLTDASRLLRDTIDRCERMLPPDDQLTQSVRESLANITGELRLPSELARRVTCLSPGTPGVASSHRSRGAGRPSTRCCLSHRGRGRMAVTDWSSPGPTGSRWPPVPVSTGLGRRGRWT
jgi:tetratricopeptide (TPR) repeat protein